MNWKWIRVGGDRGIWKKIKKEYGNEFITVLPCNSVGKVLRRLLQEKVETN
ncbi:MAG: hypothetical protein GXY86_15755 [Firmicutes bacterium]|nr:hypothetical protein [Bacillota bacterium]